MKKKNNKKNRSQVEYLFAANLIKKKMCTILFIKESNLSLRNKFISLLTNIANHCMITNNEDYII